MHFKSIMLSEKRQTEKQLLHNSAMGLSRIGQLQGQKSDRLLAVTEIGEERGLQRHI